MKHVLSDAGPARWSAFRLAHLVAWLLLLCCGTYLHAGEPGTTGPGAGPAAAEPEDPVAETPPAEGAPKAVNLPGFTLDLKKREVKMEAEVCLQAGILEFLVCMPNTFEHEAIFVTKAKPELLHMALLLLHLEPYSMVGPNQLWWWGRALERKASRVEIWVEWEENGKTREVPIADMLSNRALEEGEGGDPEVDPDEEMKNLQTGWVFIGSFFHSVEREGEKPKEVYATNLGGVVVSIIPQPSAVLQYGFETGNPYQGETQGLEAGGGSIPPQGTKVKLVFRPVHERKKPGAGQAPGEAGGVTPGDPEAAGDGTGADPAGAADPEAE